MTSLVDRLRDLACEGEWCSPLAQEAADHITAMEETMTTLRVGVVDGLTDDEIIAIRREVSKRAHGDKPWADTLAFAREVERMALRIPRQASEIVGRMAMQQLERVRELEAERDALRAENERLRGLLREARAHVSPYVYGERDPLELAKRIDAALAGEKPTSALD